MSVRGIALELGRAPSTISREIRRNSETDGRYRPHQAERSARLRACRPRTRRIALDTVLAETVRELLGQRWSPEQVAHELREVFVGQRSRWLCKETIYQAIYDPAVEITRPVRRRRRRRRLRGLQRRGRLTAMRMIDERPAEVADRLQAGRWEGDLIMGAGNRSAIGTLVERTTRFLILLPFSDGIATTDGVRHAITSVLGNLPQPLRRTLTWDQGKELAMHQQITASTGTGVYFCDAHSPWQRGSNENMNGLLRDYFPKGTELGVHSAEDIARIAAEVNERPRKTLECRRPAALFNSQIAVATVEARGPSMRAPRCSGTFSRRRLLSDSSRQTFVAAILQRTTTLLVVVITFVVLRETGPRRLDAFAAQQLFLNGQNLLNALGTIKHVSLEWLYSFHPLTLLTR